MDPRYVSMDAPLGRALLGKRVDTELTIERPDGPQALVVCRIRYGD